MGPNAADHRLQPERRLKGAQNRVPRSLHSLLL